jgi:hypothetical protein
LISRTRQRRAKVLDVARQGEQEQTRQRRPEQLDGDVAQDPFPRSWLSTSVPLPF